MKYLTILLIALAVLSLNCNKKEPTYTLPIQKGECIVWLEKNNDSVVYELYKDCNAYQTIEANWTGLKEIKFTDTWSGGGMPINHSLDIRRNGTILDALDCSTSPKYEIKILVQILNGKFKIILRDATYHSDW
jgi:hypothetical protein